MHNVYILVAPNEEGLDRIIEHHCKSRQRTISCYNHVGFAIWLLGGGLELDTRPPAVHLDGLAVRLTRPDIQINNEDTDDADEL